MASEELEQFARRLSEALGSRYRHSGANEEYLRVGDVKKAIQAALNPADAVDGYPYMLFRETRDKYRIVNDSSEEAAAVVEGWSRNIPPQYEEGYPRWYAERPPQRDGWKRYDWRRITAYNSAELQQFLAVTEAADWVEDGPENQYGARCVGIADLISERKEMLKSIIDNEPLPASEPASDEPANDDVEVSAEEVSEVTDGN